MVFIMVRDAHAEFFFWTNCVCLKCFHAVGWAAGRASGLKKLTGGVLAWLSGCFSKIQIGFTFLVPARPDIPGQRAVKRVL